LTGTLSSLYKQISPKLSFDGLISSSSLNANFRLALCE
jgi:hypothetical protein